MQLKAHPHVRRIAESVPRRITLLGILVVIVAIAIGLGSIAIKARARSQAADLLKRGFGAVAAEVLDRHRQAFVKNADDCRLLLSSYFQAWRLERLEWAAQACLESGNDFLEEYLSLVTVREYTNRDSEALQILETMTHKFEKSADVFIRLGQLLRKTKQDARAAEAFSRGVELAPDNAQLNLEILQYFSSLRLWMKAKPIADRLKNAKTDDPAVKLVLARVMLNAEDPSAAQSLVAQARDLENKLSADERAKIESTYGDILNVAFDSRRGSRGSHRKVGARNESAFTVPIPNPFQR